MHSLLDYEAFRLMFFTTLQKARLKVTHTLKKITVDHDPYVPFLLALMSPSFFLFIFLSFEHVLFDSLCP